MYVKLFATILDSSVWLESHATVRVWITFLAAKDSDGFCRFAAMENLAHRARVTVEEAAIAVGKLESPDVNSSNKDHEGRRIERVPGGWMVLNHQMYADMVKKEDERRSTRSRVQKHRANLPAAPGSKRPGALPEYDAVFEEAWAIYPKREGNSKSAAWRQWLARVAQGVDPIDMLTGTKGYAASCIRRGTEPDFIKLAATFYGRDRHFASDFSIVTGTKAGHKRAAPGEASYRNAKDALDGL